MKKIIALIISQIALGSVWATSDQDDVLRAFEDKPGYVRPIGTLMGTNNNGGWISSARVGKLFAYEMGLAVNLAYISDKDKYYTDVRPNGCAELRAAGTPCPDGVGDFTHTRVPTAYGPDEGGFYSQYVNATTELPYDTILHGNKDVRLLSVLPWVFPQVSFSLEHTRLSFRLIPLGWLDMSAFGGITILGVGLQYDVSRFLPPEVPIDLSLAMGWTYSKIGYHPGRNWEGKLNVATTGENYALVMGYRLKFLEIFAEMGYETATFSASGSLRRNRDGNEERIQPGIEIDGRNGWRLATGLTFHLKEYKPTVSQSFGAQIGTQINVLRFTKDLNETSTEKAKPAKKKRAKAKRPAAPSETEPAVPAEIDATAVGDSAVPAVEDTTPSAE